MAKMSFTRIKENVTYILNRAKSIHPSQLARDKGLIGRLVSIINSMLSEEYSEDEIGEILEMIKSTNIDLFNRVIESTKDPVKCRQIHSKYSWHQKLKRMRSK